MASLGLNELISSSPIQYPWISTIIPDTIVKWTLRNKIQCYLSELNFLWKRHIMGQYYWFIHWLVAKWHQANRTINIVLSSTRTLGTHFNWLLPSDTIYRHRSGSTLVHIMAWRHQAITWTNVDLSSIRFSDIHLQAISQEIPQSSITNINLKIY